MSATACQRHTASSLAAVIGLSANDVISLRSLRCVCHFVNSLRCVGCKRSLRSAATGHRRGRVRRPVTAGWLTLIYAAAAAPAPPTAAVPGYRRRAHATHDTIDAAAVITQLRQLAYGPRALSLRLSVFVCATLTDFSTFLRPVVVVTAAGGFGNPTV